MFPSLDQNPYRILVVDDDPDVHELLGILIRSIKGSRFKILHAMDGAQGLDLFLASAVDLVITDLGMPQMDGLDLIKTIRAHERGAGLPILFLTAYETQEARILAFESGATDFIVKPFLKQEFQARLLGYLERSRAYQTVLVQQRAIQADLAQARETQKILLPQEPPKARGARFAARYEPMYEIGGDFYDFFELPSGAYGFCIGDVTGHGISAALLSFMISGLFKSNAMRHLSPARVLDATNHQLLGRVPGNRFATMIYAVFNPDTLTLTHANGSHPDALLLRRGEPEPIPLPSRGMILGQFTGPLAEYSEQVFQLEPGDKVLLITDGIVEIPDRDGEFLGLEGLMGFLRANSGLGIQDLLDALMAHGLEHSGGRGFTDDITLVGMELDR